MKRKFTYNVDNKKSMSVLQPYTSNNMMDIGHIFKANKFVKVKHIYT
jgi:hypothetical protein